MNAFGDYLSTLISPRDRAEKTSKRKYEPKEPHHIIPVGEDDAELAVWQDSSKYGRSVRFNLRRRNEDGKLLATLRAEALPEIIVGLLGFCRKLSTAEEWVEDTVRERLAFLCDHLEAAVNTAPAISNGEANKSNDLFGDVN